MDLKAKIREFVSANLNAIIISLLCVVYVCVSSVLVVVPTGASPWTIISNMGTAFAFGVIVNYFFREVGLANGEKTPQVAAAREEYVTAARKAVSDFEGLQAFCVRMNAEALKNERMKILTRVGLSYSEWFGEDGRPVANGYNPTFVPKGRLTNTAYRIKHNALEKSRVHALDRAITLRIREMDAAGLLSEDERVGDPFNFGYGRRTFRVISTLKNVGTKIFTSLATGLYTVTLISQFGWAGLLWSLLQVSIVIALGVWQMLSSADYMINGYAQRLRAKAMYINKYVFEKEQKNGQKKED